ncbi:hypothetical protein FIBSPDRAFT_1038011 [Athelia psychrophila]|uniref:G-protein coupled receptors family 1 profile domain-containing protein n=1 Tax=Athelia psychrophila TaxID=1759441 RepID=A0A166TLS0_9AGAM|nr:hypothetical protein FIBSPDRAFT_1038011 [Fibularhizoctonia sp. CBS 109695]
MHSFLPNILVGDQANQSSKYIFLAQFVWYTYDWLLSISEECEVATRLSWSIAIYFTSRVSALGQMLCLMLFRLVPIAGCTPLYAMAATFACLAGVSTSFLFFIRVRAVYLCSRSITVTFGALWIATIVFNITQYTTVHIEHIAGSQSCETINSYDGHTGLPSIGNVVYEFLVFLPSIGNVVYDTLVFLAISYRLAANMAPGNGWRARLQPLVKGKHLYIVSSALMRSGQLYYFATILVISANFVLMYSSLVPVDYRFLCLGAVSVFVNIMACRVFRGVALETMYANDSLARPSPTGTGIAAALQLATLPS